MSLPSPETLLVTVREAAFAAGRVIQSQQNAPRERRLKLNREIVTRTDSEAQAAAIAVIRAQYADHGILAEEDGLNSGVDEEGRWQPPAGYSWMIDPVDGTTNYAHGLPMYCVSVAVAYDGELIAGVVYDPNREEVFEASRGGGARLNGTALPQMEAPGLRDAVMCTDWAHSPEGRRLLFETFPRLAPLGRTTRIFGSAALALCYVAAGRVHLYFNCGLKPWDAAAGVLIVREAGGDASALRDERWRPGEPTVVAAHPELLSAAIHSLR